MGVHGDTRWGNLILTAYKYTKIKSVFTGLLGKGQMNTATTVAYLL